MTKKPSEHSLTAEGAQSFIASFVTRGPGDQRAAYRQRLVVSACFAFGGLRLVSAVIPGIRGQPLSAAMVILVSVGILSLPYLLRRTSNTELVASLLFGGVLLSFFLPAIRAGGLDVIGFFCIAFLPMLMIGIAGHEELPCGAQHRCPFCLRPNSCSVMLAWTARDSSG